jgi:hypothetical protein
VPNVPPDFLSRLVALANFMRLFLKSSTGFADPRGMKRVLLQVRRHGRSLRSPGFPVKIGGLGELHAVPARRDRTRGRWSVLRSRKSGYAPVGMTNWFEIEDFARQRLFCNRIVIPPVPACRGTEAKRSGGTCCFAR